MKKYLSALVLGGAFVAPSVCLASSPPTPAPSPVPSPAHFDLWGFDLCLVDAPPGVACDFTLRPSSSANYESATASMAMSSTPKRFSVLGRNVCLGEASPTCDINIPVSDPPAHQGHDKGS